MVASIRKRQVESIPVARVVVPNIILLSFGEEFEIEIKTTIINHIKKYKVVP